MKCRVLSNVPRSLFWTMLGIGLYCGASPAQNLADGTSASTLIQRGLEAVQARDQLSANNAFSQVRRQEGPQGYAEIGRAEAKIPGRDRRVLCWLAAYLADDPKATDASEVKAQIDKLHAESQAQVTGLLTALQNALNQSPPGEARNYGLRDMVGQWAGLGDFTAARKVIDLIDDPNTKSDALTNLVSAYCQLIHQQVDRGDMPGAQASVAEANRTWKQIPNFNIQLEAEYYVASSWIGLARGQVRAGEWKGVQESLAIALKLNGDLTSPGDTNNVWDNVAGVQVAMAEGQLKAADQDGAHVSIAAALQTADLLRNDPFREEASVLEDIANAQLQAGDASGAQGLLVRARNLTKDNVSLGYIAVDQALAGDTAGATSTLKSITDESTRARFRNEIDRLHDEKPLHPPLPSDLVLAPSVADGYSWIFILGQGLDSPVFTSFPDYSDLKAVAIEILKEPVRNGPQFRTDLPLDRIRVLTLVTNHLLAAQTAIDSMLALQFKH